jgi:site-specific recombinase XerD
MSASTELVRVPVGDARVEAAFAQVLADLGSPESVRAYREEWERFVAWLRTRSTSPLAARTLDVQTYLLELRAKAKRQSTRARALAVIRAIYAAFARVGLLEGANPAREARNPKGDNAPLKTPWIEEAELERFLSVVPDEDDFIRHRDYLITLTLALTGLRRAEVARVAIDAFTPRVDNDNWNLLVRVKGSKHGTIEVVAPLVHQLQAWAKKHNITAGAVFRKSPKAAHGVGVSTVRNAVKRQAKRAGFVDDTKFAPHAFRRSLATIAKKRGVSVETVQRSLLHSKKDTTLRYMQLADAPDAPAKAFLDLMPKKLRSSKKPK